MGIDIYMEWNGKTETDKKSQLTGFVNAGECGYLRGAYFGGYGDVLRKLFSWANWEADDSPFNADAFENELIALIDSGGERPDKGLWDHTKGSEKGWDLSERQNTLVDPEFITQCEAFLAFGRRLEVEGKNPKVYISY